MNKLGTEKKEPSRRLAEINRAITTSLNFDRVLDLIVENAAELVNAKISALLLVDVILGYAEVLSRSDEAQRSPFVSRAAEILKRNALSQSQLVRL